MRVTSTNLDNLIDASLETRQRSPIEEIAMNSSNPALFMNNGWTDFNEESMIKLGGKCAAYKWMHQKTYFYLNIISAIINTIILITSTSLSVETTVFVNNFSNGTVSGSESQSNGLDIFKIVGIYLVTILTTISNFFKFDESSANHKNQCIKYLELYQGIQQEMSVYRRDRKNAQEYISSTNSKYDSLILTGPDVSSFVMNMYKREFGEGKIDTIEPIQVNDQEETSDVPGTVVVDTINTANTVDIEIEARQEEVSRRIDPLDKLAGITPNVSLGDIDACMKLTGDITDKNVEDMDNDVIKKLNEYWIDKRSKYEYERFLNL